MVYGLGFRVWGGGGGGATLCALSRPHRDNLCVVYADIYLVPFLWSPYTLHP